jgi:hypothetical protein
VHSRYSQQQQQQSTTTANTADGALKVCVNVIRTMGGVGLLAVKSSPSSVDHSTVLRSICVFLLSTFPSGKLDRSSLWPTSEALDTIFDVFAEDDHNAILQETGLVSKLKALAPQFKRAVGSSFSLSNNLPRFS